MRLVPLLLLLIALDLAFSYKRFVDSVSGIDTNNNCTSWHSPCATVRHAIVEAIEGDEVVVAASGVVNESSLFVNKSLSFIGFDTVLDAQGKGRLVEVDNASSVLFVNITFRNGRVGDGNGGMLKASFLNCECNRNGRVLSGTWNGEN